MTSDSIHNTIPLNQVDFYQEKLAAFDVAARSSLAENQAGHDPLIDPNLNVNDLSQADFPRSSLDNILSSDLGYDERELLITYLLGVWYLDQVQGRWSFVPRRVNNPTLFLSFGVGVSTHRSMLNIANMAYEILEGEQDADFAQTLLISTVSIELKNSS